MKNTKQENESIQLEILIAAARTVQERINEEICEPMKELLISGTEAINAPEKFPARKNHLLKKLPKFFK